MPNPLTREDLIGTVYGGMEVIDAERVKLPSAYQWRITLCCMTCGKAVTMGLQCAKTATCRACATARKYDGQTVHGFLIRATLGTDQHQRRLVRAVCPVCGAEFTAAYVTLSTRKSCGCLAETTAERNFAITPEINHPMATGVARARNIKPGRKTNRNNSTGVKGVSRVPDGTYRAYITLVGRQIYLGTFPALADAAAARAAAEEHYFAPLLPEADTAPPPDGYIPLGDYAARQGKSPKAALYHALCGHFPAAVQRGSSWFIDPSTQWPPRQNAKKAPNPE